MRKGADINEQKFSARDGEPMAMIYLPPGLSVRITAPHCGRSANG